MGAKSIVLLLESAAGCGGCDGESGDSAEPSDWASVEGRGVWRVPNGLEGSWYFNS